LPDRNPCRASGEFDYVFEYPREANEGVDMLTAVMADAGHPVVAGLLGLGAAGLAAAVVVMAWSVHIHQIRLAGQLARRQFLMTPEAAPAAPGVNGHGNGNGNGHGNGHGSDPSEAEAREAARPAATGLVSPVVIDGPDTVVAGEQVRYRVQPSGTRKVMSWAAGGGSVAQAPDPGHPDELLLVADQPGTLMLTVRVREGMTETRGMKSITAVPEVTEPAPPFTLRLFLHGWGLVAVAVLIVGFAGALDALGNLASSEFIALVAPLAALLAVVLITRGTGDTSSSRPATGKDSTRPRA
jgi:hypothetical protein